MLTIDHFLSRIPKNFSTLVIEGPDSVGKSWIVNKIQNNFAEKIDFPRFPDNRDDVGIRNILFQTKMSKYRSASPFLFMADFVYWWESQMSNRVTHNSKMVWDRGLPSLVVYQNLDPAWIVDALTVRTNLPEFRKFLSEIDYVFLNPVDMDSYFKRLASKSVDDTNAYDPDSTEAVYQNIESYREVAKKIQDFGQEEFPRRSVTIVDI